jgi:hypothetical protein
MGACLGLGRFEVASTRGKKAPVGAYDDRKRSLNPLFFFFPSSYWRSGSSNLKSHRSPLPTTAHHCPPPAFPTEGQRSAGRGILRQASRAGARQAAVPAPVARLVSRQGGPGGAGRHVPEDPQGAQGSEGPWGESRLAVIYQYYNLYFNGAVAD